MSTFSPFRIKERMVAVRLVLLASFVVILGAFFRAQVIEHEGFQERSEKNRLRRLNLAAPRGFILDREGKPIAENAPGFTIKLFATSKDSLRAVLGRMAEYSPVDDDLIEQVTRRFDAARYQPALVFGSAPIETVAKLEEHRYLLPGLVVQTEPRRLYPAGRAIAHLVGYVAEVTESDLESNRYARAKSGTIVGKDGLEQRYDSIVRGVEGESYIEVDAR
ncbi:MAG: penicillin-binding protein 2, partial [Gemmatimonadota bacterium]